MPFVFRLPHNRGGQRRWLTVEGEGVRLFEEFSGIGMDRVFVRLPFFDIGKKSFPDATLIPSWIELMRTGIPMIEIPDHGNTSCVGCPNCKERTFPAVEFHEVGSKLFIKVEVLSRPEQVYIKIREQAKMPLRFRGGLAFGPFSHVYLL